MQSWTIELNTPTVDAEPDTVREPPVAREKGPEVRFFGEPIALMKRRRVAPRVSRIPGPGPDLESVIVELVR